MSTSTKWIKMSPEVSVAMTIQGNWFALDSDRRKALFDLVDRFVALEITMPEPSQTDAPTDPRT